MTSNRFKKLLANSGLLTANKTPSQKAISKTKKLSIKIS
jgi:hypothetical protein